MSSGEEFGITGTVAPGFEGVRDAFIANFERNGEVGASCSVFHRGRHVVDLAGGRRSEDETAAPYDADTLQLVFSATKGATAMCAHLLAERGQLDLDAPVAEYWPEFEAAGKGEVPVSWLLCHKSGLADIDESLTFAQGLDWDFVTSRLAAAEPLWEPGTQHGYHAVTYGWLVGEIVRRVSGKSLGTFFNDEFAQPLGLDFWIGLPEEIHDRVAPIILMGPPPGMDFGTGPDGRPAGFVEMLQMLLGKDALIARALSAPGGAFGDLGAWNDPELWKAEIGSANGITTARSLAKLYAASVGEVDGVRTLKAETIERAIEVHTLGPDAVLIFEIPFGLGFMRDSPLSRFGSPSAFGHYGAGGAVGFADPEAELGFGYVMNKMQLGIAGDPRTAGLIDATYAALHA